MTDSMRVSAGRWCRETRLSLDISQQQLANATGLGRGYIASIECGLANPTLAVIERLADALGVRLQLLSTPTQITLVVPPRQRDAVHARCSGYVDRRLRAAGWLTSREVRIGEGGLIGWIDILAWHPTTGALLVVEVKSRIDDLGAIERQLGWYERLGGAAAREHGWIPSSVVPSLLLLASAEVDEQLRLNRDVVERAFPASATDLGAVVDGEPGPLAGPAVALIDPMSRRRVWLIRTRAQGRRSMPRYVGFADAARQFSGR